MVIVAAAAMVVIAAFTLKYAADHRDFSQNVPAMNQALESVVFVRAYDPAGTRVSQGGGFVVFDGKTVVTNLKTIGEGMTVSVFAGDGRAFEAVSVSAYDADWDWALLLLGEDTGLAPLELGAAQDASPGDGAVILSAASKSQRIISLGTFNSSVSGPLAGPALCITADYAPLQGGVVFDQAGRAVGLTCPADPEAAEDLIFAVPMDKLPPQGDNREVQTLEQVYLETHPEASYERECIWLGIDTLCANPARHDGRKVGLEGYVRQVDDLVQLGATDSTIVYLTSGKADTNSVRVIITPGTTVEEDCQWTQGTKLRVYGECLYGDDFGAELTCIYVDAKIVKAAED